MLFCVGASREHTQKRTRANTRDNVRENARTFPHARECTLYRRSDTSTRKHARVYTALYRRSHPNIHAHTRMKVPVQESCLEW